MTASVKPPAASKPLKHPVDQVPRVPKLALYGLQHVMAFYAGAVLVPILVASGLGLSGDQLIHLINADLFKEYKQKFGFPFIVCAREIDSYTKVVDLRWARLANSPKIEHSTALIEIAKIANYRFDDLVADANPIATARTLRYQEAYRG